MHRHRAGCGTRFEGAFLQTDFASFMTWRDWGFPEAGVTNCFSMGALRTSDGGWIMGVMAPHTSAAGKIYFPAGTPDPGDIVDGIGRSRRQRDPRGRRGDRARRRRFHGADGWHCVIDGPRIALMKVLQAHEPAEVAAPAHPRSSRARSDARACGHPDRALRARLRSDDAALRHGVSRSHRLSRIHTELTCLPAKFIERYRIDKPDRFRLADFDTADTARIESRQGRGQGAARGGCRASRRIAGAALCRGQVGGADRAAGHGHRRQGRRHRARHGGRQSAGLHRAFVQGAERGGDRPRFPVAVGAAAARARAHRHLQPLALRRGAGGARPSGVARAPEAAAEPHRQGRSGSIASRASAASSAILRAAERSSSNSSCTSRTEEQRQRLLARLDEPAKRWKFSAGDIAERKLWDKYMAAYEDAIRATSREHAPWYVVPADSKPFARLVVARAIVDALSRLDLKYPEGRRRRSQGDAEDQDGAAGGGRRRSASRVAAQSVLLHEGFSLLRLAPSSAHGGGANARISLPSSMSPWTSHGGLQRANSIATHIVWCSMASQYSEDQWQSARVPQNRSRKISSSRGQSGRARCRYLERVSFRPGNAFDQRRPIGDHGQRRAYFRPGRR